uniref:Kelch-like protein diablo n=1 Tax=Glossina pallidipes TaxID=7398 RepID=A0A1A9ZNW4_GLOPL
MYNLSTMETTAVTLNLSQDDRLKLSVSQAVCEDVNINVVETLVEYVYTGTITLTEDNVEELLITSDLFQIDWVKKECENFLESIMNSSNCFQIWRLADMTSCKSLRDVAHKYILGHFDDLFESEELLLLRFKEIKELITDDHLSVRSEDNVYKTVLNWVKYDQNNRKVHLVELMSYIRLHLISPPFLRNNVSTEPLLKEDPKYDKLLLDAAFYQLTPVNERKCVPGRVRIKKIPECCNENFHVFLLGGNEPDDCLHRQHNRCKVYDFSRRKLVSIANMNSRRSSNSAIALNGFIYSVGGKGGLEGTLETAERYDPFNKRWNYIASMMNPRKNTAICTHNHSIYAIGGTGSRSVEKYSPALNIWEWSVDVHKYGDQCHAAALADNIYCFVDNSRFCFDPREGRWHKLNDTTDEGYFKLVSCVDALFYIGERECKFLDIRVNRWESMPPISKREGFSAVAHNNIYVLGGTKDNKDETNVERYNIRNNEWTIVDSMEIVPRSGGILVIDGCFNLN